MSGRQGFSVALLGADGAGKTTVGRALVARWPGRIEYLYMGINPSASNRQLPTTRLVNRLRGRTNGRSAGAPPTAERSSRSIRRLLRTTVTPIRLLHRISEEWYRQLVAWRAMRHGTIVLYDRHFFFDYFATDVDRRSRDRSLSRRIHGLVLERAYPRPDLVIFLDAPPDVLFARKGEGTLDSLATRRRDYRAFRTVVPHFVEVDATQPLAPMLAEIEHLIDHFDRHRSLPGERQQ